MELTDKIYLVEDEVDIFGERIPVKEVSLNCRVMSRHVVPANQNASTIENRYEIKVYIPYLRTEPYSGFWKKNVRLFRYENNLYDLVLKVIVKDFFGTPHHYEVTLSEKCEA